MLKLNENIEMSDIIKQNTFQSSNIQKATKNVNSNISQAQIRKKTHL